MIVGEEIVSLNTSGAIDHTGITVNGWEVANTIQYD